MWSNKQKSGQDEDDSWEVRAFEEDTTGNLMSCTWPPRSYTCTFCRREFRSAQALGGHMNVHRRDRAKMHELPSNMMSPSDKSSTQPTILIPTHQDLIANGLCLLYSLPNPNALLIPTPSINGQVFSSLSPNKAIDFPFTATISSLAQSRNIDEPPPSSDSQHYNSEMGLIRDSSTIDEELDLELRLGRKSP